MIYIVYASIGEILQKIDSPIIDKGPTIVSIVPDATGFITTDDLSVTPQTHRVNLTTLEPELKTAVPAPNTQSATVDVPLIISGLPDCTVTVNGGEAVDIPDGEVDFTTDLAGEYTLVFSSPLYLDTTTVITVTD